MSDRPSVAVQAAMGGVMVGSTVARAAASRDFKGGDLVPGDTWQDGAVSDCEGLTALCPGDPHPPRAQGVLGLPDIDCPVAGATVVGAAASGVVSRSWVRSPGSRDRAG